LKLTLIQNITPKTLNIMNSSRLNTVHPMLSEQMK